MGSFQSLKEGLRAYSSVSARALAVWRICLGIALAANFTYYWQAADVFYVDGLFSPELYGSAPPLLSITSQHAWALFFGGSIVVSLALAAGVPGARWVLPILHGLAAQRAYVLETGGAAVMALALALCWLLPINHDLSFHCKRLRGSFRAPPTLVRSPGYALALLQLAVNYGFNAYNKLTEPWETGVALSRALGNPGLSTPIGAWINQHLEGALPFLNYAALALEGLLPFLLLSPFRRRECHLAAAALMFVLHLGIALTLEVGTFGWIMLAQIPLLLFRPRASHQPPVLAATPAVTRFRKVTAWVFLYLMLHSLGQASNPAGLVRGKRPTDLLYLPQWTQHITRSLSWYQGWGMFAWPPGRSFVTVTTAETKSGKHFDPWRHRAAGDMTILQSLPRSAFRNHTFSSFETIFMRYREAREALSQWIAQQPHPDDPQDKIIRFYSFSLSVPAEHQHRVSERRIIEHTGLHHHTALKDSISTLRASGWGLWKPERAVDGLIVREGTPVFSPVGTSFAPGCAHLIVYFEQPQEIRSIFVQADGFDRYLIEGSQDGKTFSTLGTIERHNERQFRSRMLQVHGTQITQVRVRPATPGARQGYLAEIAFFGSTQDISSWKIPDSTGLPDADVFVANFEHPAALGALAWEADGKCPWD